MAPADAPTPTGWAILTDRSTPDLRPVLERFAMVYRHPVAGEPEMVPGQPCFLFRTDRSQVLGIWAVGEVVAPRLDLPAGMAFTAPEVLLLGDAEATTAPPARSYAEVEVLELEKPLADDALRGHRVLAGSRLLDPSKRPDAPGPMPLSAAEVRAIETFDFWFVEPDDDQRAALDRLLADEEPLLPE